MLQCSTAWPPAPTPATGTLYSKLCSPKSCKPLLLPASHPETPPGCPRAHSTHPRHLLHPSFLLLPQPRQMSNPPCQTRGAAAHCPGQRCAGEPRQGGCGHPACPGKSRVFARAVVRVFAIATAMEETLHLPKEEPSPSPLQHGVSYQGKMFHQNAAFCTLKMGEGGGRFH